MTRKISAYARRMRRAPDGGTFNGAEWLNTFQRCRGYTDETIPGAFNADGGQTITAARGAALRVRAAFDNIKTGQVPGDDTEPHDMLAHALGLAWLRAIDIAGPDIVVAQVFHGAHAKALVAEQRVAHAEDADAAGHIFFRHEVPPFFGKERGGSG